MTETIIYSILASIFIPLLLCVLTFGIIFGFAAKKTIQSTPKYTKEDKRNPIYQIIAFAAMSMMLIAFGLTPAFIKGCIFFLILLYASISDIRTHEVQNFVSLLICITALIGIDFSNLYTMLLSGAAVFALLFVCAVLSNNRIGGADVKLSAACAFLLGFKGGMAGLVIGLFLAVVCNHIFNRKDKCEAFPLVPYLSVGYMVMFVVENAMAL